MPEFPPVTTATFPFNLLILGKYVKYGYLKIGMYGEVKLNDETK